MRKLPFTVFGALVLAACALAYIPHIPILPMVESGAIKTWDTTSKVTASDLNGNFQHIHNNMVGGHGARLLDADVSATAAIASSKLAGYRYIPVVWSTVIGSCTATPCTVAATVGVTGITRTSAGIYTVTFSPARLNTNFAVLVTPVTCNAGNCSCTAVPLSTSTHSVVCTRTDTGTNAAVDASFSTMVMDND